MVILRERTLVRVSKLQLKATEQKKMFIFKSFPFLNSIECSFRFSLQISQPFVSY